MSEENRRWLEGELVRHGFADYQELTEELNKRLEAEGAEYASRSAVHRYGRVIEDRIAKIKQSTEIAKTMAAEVGDDEGALNAALIKLVQNRLLDVMLDPEVERGEIDYTKFGRAIADLGRAAVQQNRHQLDVRTKLEAKLRALETQAKGAKSGLDPETLRRVREEIYGVV